MSEAFETSQTFRRIVVQNQKFPYVDYQDKNSSWLLSAANFLENCFPDSVLVLCKIKHPTIAYVSGNCEAIIGYTSQYLKAISPEEYFSLIHPADRTAVKRLYERMELHTKSKGYRPENWKFTFHYRLRLKDEKYIYIQDEKAAFLDTSNHYVHYSILRIQQDLKFLNSPFFTLSKKFNHSFRHVDIYVPKNSTEALTPRERQVLKCLDSGMSTKEMANELSVSAFTVRNHKTSLFKKLKVKTGLQALRNARKLTWL